MAETLASSAATGTLFTVSAPSGAGKTSLVKALIESEDNILVSVSHTTREQRPNEQDGLNYNFVSQRQFEEMIAADAFLEYAEVFGNFYGTSKDWVIEKLRSGTDVILEIDWQGAQQVRRWADAGDIFYSGIFILPPSLQALKERLDNRGQDDDAVIARRMKAAVDEMSHFDSADFLVVNDDFKVALAELRLIIQSAGLRQPVQQLRHSGLLEELLSAS